MDTHLFCVQKTSFQLLCKWVLIYLLCSIIFFSGFLQIGTHVFFSQDLCEITLSCRSNSWTNQIYSKLHKINPSLKSIKKFPLQTNPLLANLIDSSQLNLKFWFEINCDLETWSSWVIMCDVVVLDCISVSCSSAYGGLLARYNENGSTSSVKVMNHVNMLLWAMDHPPPTKMYVILTL